MIKIEDLVENIDKDDKPGTACPEADAALAYTKFLCKLHESRYLAGNFEAHSGFGQDYPGSPMIDKDFYLTDAETEVLKRMKDRKPFRVDNAEYLDIVQEVYVGLAKAHSHVSPALRHDGRWNNSKRSSYYTPHIVMLTGQKSIITVLHEYTHSLGFGEVVATWWSTNAFKLLYPKSYGKLKRSMINPHLLRKNLEDKFLAPDDFSKRRPFSEFKTFLDEREDFFKALAKEEKEKLKIEEKLVCGHMEGDDMCPDCDSEDK